jgi:hypothetical protein
VKKISDIFRGDSRSRRHYLTHSVSQSLSHVFANLTNISHMTFTILSMQSYPRNPIHAILSMQSYPCNPIHAILPMQSYRCNPIHPILYIQSYTYNPIHPILYIQSYPSNPIHPTLSIRPYLTIHTTYTILNWTMKHVLCNMKYAITSSISSCITLSITSSNNQVCNQLIH